MKSEENINSIEKLKKMLEENQEEFKKQLKEVKMHYQWVALAYSYSLALNHIYEGYINLNTQIECICLKNSLQLLERNSSLKKDWVELLKQLENQSAETEELTLERGISEEEAFVDCLERADLEGSIQALVDCGFMFEQW